MASAGLPGKCRRHEVFTPDCRYCRNMSGMATVGDAGIPVIGQAATQRGAVPDMSGAYPSLAGLIPLYDRVIVIPLEAGEKQGSIVIPETVHETWPLRVGRVVAVGQGRVAHTTGELVGLICEVGDVVVYDRKAGTELPWDDDEEAVLLREPEILGFMPRTPADAAPPEAA